MYTYLLRLARQGLLTHANVRWGRLSYSLTARGQARLNYLQTKQTSTTPDRTRPHWPWERT
jgi:DNA-binding PadR family transcriptional regulator